MKTLLTTSILTLSLAVASLSPAYAAKPTTESLVKLKEVSQMTSQFKQMGTMSDEMITSMVDSQFAMLNDDEINPDQMVEIKKLVTTYANKISQDMFTPELEKLITDSFINVAGEHYTQDEVDALITFYDSPMGQSITSKQATVMQDYMTDVLPYIMAKSKESQQKYLPMMMEDMIKVFMESE